MKKIKIKKGIHFENPPPKQTNNIFFVWVRDGMQFKKSPSYQLANSRLWQKGLGGRFPCIPLTLKS